MPVPRPSIPVATGRPVAFVRTPDAGVPRAGVVSVGDVNVLFVRVSVTSFRSVPLSFSYFPEARSMCSDEVHESVASTQLNVLSVAPFNVIPPPSAVVSVGVSTSPRTTFLSSTTRLVEFIFVVVPFTVKSPERVSEAADTVPVNVGSAFGARASNCV